MCTINHDTIATCCIGEATLAATLDSNVVDAIQLIAHLRFLGYSLHDAMCATADAVHCGLVSHT